MGGVHGTAAHTSANTAREVEAKLKTTRQVCLRHRDWLKLPQTRCQGPDESTAWKFAKKPSKIV